MPSFELDAICDYLKKPSEFVSELHVSKAIFDEIRLWVGSVRVDAPGFSLEGMPILVDPNYRPDWWSEHFDGKWMVGFRLHGREMKMAEKTLGNIGYDAYCKFTDNKSLITGAPLPPFAELKTPIQEAWEKAGQAVAASVGHADRITGYVEPITSTAPGEPSQGQTQIVK